MTTSSSPQTISADIQQLLGSLRRRIRVYVWLEGIAAAIIWVAATFWIGLALDYLPVLLGASEMPRPARMVILAFIGLVLAYILYRQILRRAFVRLADESMAVLLEKYFGFDASLITAVEMSGREEVNQDLLTQTQEAARAELHQVQLSQVFNYRPLAARLVFAAILLITLGSFYALNAQAMELGLQRIYFLNDEPWPRQARIELIGVELADQELSGFGLPIESQREFEAGELRVARGAEVTLLVRADARAPVVPDQCILSYRTESGGPGRVSMTRLGGIRQGYQYYRYSGQPFKGMLEGVTFSVLGFDHRLPEQRIEVVDPPTVVKVELDCTFPPYMVDEETSSWLPRTVDFAPGIQLPRGTRIHFRWVSNKPLRKVFVCDGDAEQSESLVTTLEVSPGQNEAFYDAVLDAPLALDLVFLDEDAVSSRRPHRIYLGAIEDTPPVVDLKLKGIGTAVTPQVRLELQGTVRDDYGVERTWVELLINDGTPRETDVPPGETFSRVLDMRELAGANKELSIGPQDKLRLIIKAKDKYDLSSDHQLGISDAYELDVVTANELLAILEAREVSLRQRFEQIIEESLATRDSLLRVRNEGPASVEDPAEEEADELTADELTADALTRVWSLRQLRSQRALLQMQKSSQETLGVAESFFDICDELVNNRVDSEDRQARLKEKIATPLKVVAELQFPEVEKRLQTLLAGIQQQLDGEDPLEEEVPSIVQSSDSAIAQVDAILLELNTILENMADLQSYNELLDIVRTLIENQEKLIDRTKREQKKQVLDLFD